MPGSTGGSNESLLKLLVTATTMVEQQLHARLLSNGHVGVRPAHYAVFRHLDKGGSRISTLAAAAGMTAQSMGELVTDLERMGYLQRSRDPSDGRARIVFATEMGQRALESAAASLSEIETVLAERLGEQHLAELKSKLSELPDALEGGVPSDQCE